MSKEDIEQIINNAELFTPEGPRPLLSEISKPEPFPIEALEGILRKGAEAIHNITQAPLEMCAQSVLAAATLCVQGHADVQLPTINSIRPLSSFFITIAGSGERKSTCDTEASKPIVEYEKILRKEYENNYPNWERENEIWEAQRKKILRKGDSYLQKTEIKNLGSKPLKPLIPLITCPEPTYEGMCRYFVDGHPTLGIFSSEGGQFIGGYGMSKDERLKTSTALSCLWDGEPIKRMRAGEGTIILPGRRLSMHLMLQKGIANLLLSDSLLENQGLLSRILVCAPESKIGTRFHREPTLEALKNLEDYKSHLSEILKLPLRMIEGIRNELNPRVLYLFSEAKQESIRFADKIEKLMAAEGPLEHVRNIGNKTSQHAIRLAGILTLIKDINAPEIGPEEMEAGNMLAQFYVNEAMRLTEAGMTNPNLFAAQKLLKWFMREGEEFYSLPCIYQYGPYQDSKKAKELVAILEEYGWLIKQPQGMNIRSHYRQDVWKVIRS